MRLNDFKKFVSKGRGKIQKKKTKKKQKRLESKAKQRKWNERKGIGEMEKKKENDFFTLNRG